ncbi:MAG: hypothetical protein QNJ46_29680 [Leptolyngbyaceae cyanobacterium MO_188.B28]|nr:hypothetical protein [Leptolyngbyaceae cyanobacterium MO_188.B28]
MTTDWRTSFRYRGRAEGFVYAENLRNYLDRQGVKLKEAQSRLLAN